MSGANDTDGNGVSGANDTDGNGVSGANDTDGNGVSGANDTDGNGVSVGVSATTVPLAELVDGTASRVDVGGTPVCVVRLGDDVYAIGDVCSHAHVSLSEGDVWADEREIECPKHSSTFDLRTGAPTCLPATQPVPVYDVRVEGGTVTISVLEVRS